MGAGQYGPAAVGCQRRHGNRTKSELNTPRCSIETYIVQNISFQLDLWEFSVTEFCCDIFRQINTANAVFLQAG